MKNVMKAATLESKFPLLAVENGCAARACWFEVDKLPPLAFDHDEIISKAREHLKIKLKVSPIAFRLLDEQFTMGELQRVYELISERTYDQRNFYRQAMVSGLLENINEKESSPIQLFRFNDQCYEDMEDSESKLNPFDF